MEAELALVNSEVIKSRKQNAPEIEEEIRNTVQKLSSYFPKMELAHIQAVYVFYQRDLAQALEVLEREYDLVYNKPLHSDGDTDDDEDEDVDEDDSEDEQENSNQPARLQSLAKNSMSTDTVEGFEMISRLDRQAAELVTDLLKRSTTLDQITSGSGSSIQNGERQQRDNVILGVASSASTSASTSSTSISSSSSQSTNGRHKEESQQRDDGKKEEQETKEVYQRAHNVGSMRQHELIITTTSTTTLTTTAVVKEKPVEKKQIEEEAKQEERLEEKQQQQEQPEEKKDETREEKKEEKEVVKQEERQEEKAREEVVVKQEEETKETEKVEEHKKEEERQEEKPQEEEAVRKQSEETKEQQEEKEKKAEEERAPVENNVVTEQKTEAKESIEEKQEEEIKNRSRHNTSSEKDKPNSENVSSRPSSERPDSRPASERPEPSSRPNSERPASDDDPLLRTGLKVEEPKPNSPPIKKRGLTLDAYLLSIGAKEVPAEKKESFIDYDIEPQRTYLRKADNFDLVEQFVLAGFRVTEVDRVVDSKLATRFIRRWKKFKKKYGNDSAESQSVIGFYSSDAVALQVIVKKGFSSSRGYQKNPKSPGGRLYGKGVHLGIDPKSCAKGVTSGSLLVVAALPGRISYKGGNHRRYDSVLIDNIRVLYKGSQVLPLYLVAFHDSNSQK